MEVTYLSDSKYVPDLEVETALSAMVNASLQYGTSVLIVPESERDHFW